MAGAEQKTRTLGDRLKGAVGGAAIGAALGGIGSAAIGAATKVDGAFDAIRVGTGATGAALEALQDDFKAVAGRVPDDIGVVGQVLADLNTRTGQTGEGLQALTEQILDLSRITGTDAANNVALATRAFGDWSVATEDQASTLDMFFRASQQTGIGVDKLMESVVQFGAPLRNIGFTLEESAAMMGKWEKEGVNTTLALGGLKIALGEFAKEGIDAKDGLADLIDRITNAETAAEAMALGVSKFGSRAGPDMVAAIREGRFAFDDYTESIANGTETIATATEDTEEFSDKLAGFFNSATIAVGEFAMPLAGLGNAIPGLSRLLPKMGAGLGALAGAFGSTGKAGMALAKIAPLIGAGMHAMLGPIGLVTGAIALLAAGFATDFLGMRTRLETDVNDMAMNFGTMGDTVHRLADRAGGDFQAMKDRITAEMTETGDSFDRITRRIELGTEAMTDAQWDAVEQSGLAWEKYQNQVSTSVDAAGDIVETGMDEMAEDAGELPGMMADELLAAQFHLTDATTQLVNFMDQALSPAQEKFNLQGFLASQELRDGLNSGIPIVRQKAEEMRAAAEARLAELNGYQYGYNLGATLANGMEAAEDYVKRAARNIASATGGQLRIESEPPDRSSPLYGITKWGGNIVQTIADGINANLGLGAGAAGALAGALVPSLVGPSIAGGAGAPGTGGVVNQWILNVDGVPRTVDSKRAAIDELERLGETWG